MSFLKNLLLRKGGSSAPTPYSANQFKKLEREAQKHDEKVTELNRLLLTKDETIAETAYQYDVLKFKLKELWSDKGAAQ